MGPIAAGNCYKHSLYACAKYSVYSEGTSDAFTGSRLNMEMLIVGQLSYTSIILCSFTSVSLHVMRTSLLLHNAWAWEMDCSMAQIRFLLIPSTSAFYRVLFWEADSLNKEQKAAIYCSELVPTFLTNTCEVTSRTVSHRWLAGHLPHLHNARLTTLSHTEMR